MESFGLGMDHTPLFRFCKHPHNIGQLPRAPKPVTRALKAEVAEVAAARWALMEVHSMVAAEVAAASSALM